jgi:hypothetical protein
LCRKRRSRAGGGEPTTILTPDVALKAAEASLQEARDTLADKVPGERIVHTSNE